MNRLKTVVTVTGPSCTGKTTLVRKLIETGLVKEIVSTTSRGAREGEKEGIDYKFRDRSYCESLRDSGLLAEIVEFNGNYYCTEREEVEKVFESGSVPIVIVEPKGLIQFRNTYPCFSIYVDNPIELLYTRFLTRFKENSNADPAYEAKRLSSIIKEHSCWWQEGNYDYSISRFDTETESKVMDLLIEEIKVLKNDQD